jgi:hypothetical protein
MQETTVEQQHYDRDEEYLSAQRASVEALQVGRATLSQAQAQEEQLNRAESLADETDYKLQKATRILRGMTWSGWVANMFSSNNLGPPPPSSSSGAITAGSSSSTTSSYQPPQVYENLPDTCHACAQQIQNYHANVKVLEDCESEELKATCQQVCDQAFGIAMHALQDLHDNQPHVEAYALQFARDLEILRKRQIASQQRVRGLTVVPSGNATTTSKQLFPQSAAGSVESSVPKQLTETEKIQQQQEQHLDTLSLALGELGSIAKTLNQSMTQQNESLVQLDTKSDNILEQQNMVNRRTERLIQKKSWTPVKPKFVHLVSIRHVATGQYMSVNSKNEVVLTTTYHHETCVFGVWKRQGQIFGLKNEHNRKWVGQNLFGNLTCTASSFGRREEWEASNDDWRSTKLLCASAGWGNGGYLLVRRKDYGLILGGNGTQDRNHAATWCIQELDGIGDD